MGKEIDSNEEIGMVGATPEQVKEKRKELKEKSIGGPTEDQTNIASEETMKNKASDLGLAYVDLRDFEVYKDTLELLPQTIASELRAVPYLNIGTRIRFATDQIESISEIEEKLKPFFESTGGRPQLILASKNSIDHVLSQYQTEQTSSGKKSTVTDSSPIVETKKTPATVRAKTSPAQSLKEIEAKLGKVPTTELFNTILDEAVANRTSDIHILPQESGARLRFRIDGVLQDIGVLSQTDYQKILSRVKYHGKIKLNVSQKPQDGRFGMEILGKKVDIRLSAFPSIYGESIVMRLLEEQKEFYNLDELGFSKDTLSKIEIAINRPYGMILNTGPTGSGKTTTLYAILDKLNSPHVKIITLEDPVEYHLNGITQTQIDPEHDFSFKSGLKFALRQDPDIIMVGEIRDNVTASTALHSSLTGHLMLTTFHTNNAASTFVRLLDMGLKPYLLIGSINIIIAQRLVRTLCPKCKQEYKPDRDEIATIRHLAEDKKLSVKTIYKVKGCKACNSTGFSGRTAIGETITPNKELERAILDQPTESQIEAIAKEDGMVTIAQNGVQKVLDGTTSLQELLRVVAQ